MNGRYGLIAGVVAGLALCPLGLQAVEQGDATTQEHSEQAMPGMSNEEAPPSSAAAPASAPAAAMPVAEPASAQPKAEPSAEQVRQAIRDHVAEVVSDEGTFTIEDEQTGNVRTLELAQVHEQVGKTGTAYYVCTDMKDTASGDLLDLDFDVEAVGDQLLVTDTRIHKVNGTARYTYDASNNRVPVTSTN